MSADDSGMMTSFIPFYCALDYQRNMKKEKQALDKVWKNWKELKRRTLATNFNL